METKTDKSAAWENVKADEIVTCRRCGKLIWKYWHTAKDFSKDEMDICAPCLFDKK